MEPTAHEASEIARELQTIEIVKNAIKGSHNDFVRAMREAMTDRDPKNRPLLIARIPFICNDILWIKRIAAGLLAIMIPFLGYIAISQIKMGEQLAGVAASVQTLTK